MQLALVAWLTAAMLPTPAAAQWQPDTADKRQVKAAAAVARIREKVPAAEYYFDEAWGYAVWSTITRVGVGFGGAYGRGMVVEQDEAIGTASYWQFTSGIQAGAKGFSMIIFFKDETALEEFRSGRIQFMGQAGIDVATVGAHGTPGYSNGVAVFALTRFGLMGEFTVSGVKFRYKPLETLNADTVDE
ncbi:MAG: hypothetical protein AAFN78_00825 [Pseudomonadota bacterium]